ncbi:MAG TPA: flagellin [Alphaproteobacteria bacterium]|nr:flagellin [Alphaproteobacteria bacterium]
MLSVNTNSGALVALQNLNSTNMQLNQTQNRINTGLKVAGPKDNAAVYQIAQGLRSDLAGMDAVKQSLDRAISTVDIAIAGGQQVSDLLNQMKAKAVAASDKGLDTASRTALQNDFNALRDQITTIVNNATFNGTNMLQNAGKSVSALVSSDGTSAISVAAANLSLTGSTITLTAGSTFTSATQAASVVTKLTTSIANVNAALGKLGTGASSLDSQKSFASKLSDTIQTGIGNLVDADLAKESAKLQSLQVKQQLGVQALSIANQAPQVLLSLFR